MNPQRLDIAMQWSIRRGMGFKTLAACCGIFQQNQPSDFLRAAVQCGLVIQGVKSLDVFESETPEDTKYGAVNVPGSGFD